MAAAPGALPADFTTYRLEKFRVLAERFGLRSDFVAKLRQLEGFEIVIVCDDSGSMGTPLNDQPINDAFGRRPTRWEELRSFVEITAEVATCLDPTGVDIKFMNRPGMNNVATIEAVRGLFGPPPDGGTPTCAVLEALFAEKAATLRERKMLVVLCTDGEPSAHNGVDGRKAFYDIVKGRPAGVYMSIVACTDDDGAVGFLDKLDRGVAGVDVVDDYRSEAKQIRKVQGAGFAFSFGDYVVKSLLGPVDPSFDRLDEKRCAVM